MLSRPKLGKKKDTMARILLNVAKTPQKKIKMVDVNGTNCFSIFIFFKWSVKQLLRVIVIDSPRTIKGSKFKPMNESFSKTVSSPPVVLVLVVAYSKRII